MASITACLVALTMIGENPAVLIAVSGSFKPCPVIVAVTNDPSGISPAAIALISPANGAAQAGSTINPSVLAEQCSGFTPGDVDLAAQRAASEAFARARTTTQPAAVTGADLTAAIRDGRSVTDDSALEELLDEIETRAAVELAKSEMARAA